MPVIHVATWPLKNEGVARDLIEGLTRVVHEVSGVPLDKISVYISEVVPSRWGDAGVLGTDPAFKKLSRRLGYEEV